MMGRRIGSRNVYPPKPPTFGPCGMCGQPSRVPLTGAAYCLACAGAALDRFYAEIVRALDAVKTAVREDLAAERRKYMPRP